MKSFLALFSTTPSFGLPSLQSFSICLCRRYCIITSHFTAVVVDMTTLDSTDSREDIADISRGFGDWPYDIDGRLAELGEALLGVAGPVPGP